MSRCQPTLRHSRVAILCVSGPMIAAGFAAASVAVEYVDTDSFDVAPTRGRPRVSQGQQLKTLLRARTSLSLLRRLNVNLRGYNYECVVLCLPCEFPFVVDRDPRFPLRCAAKQNCPHEPAARPRRAGSRPTGPQHPQGEGPAGRCTCLGLAATGR